MSDKATVLGLDETNRLDMAKLPEPDVTGKPVTGDRYYSKEFMQKQSQDFRTLAKNSMWITPNCHLKNFQWFFFQLIYIHIFSKSLCVQYNPV